MAAEAGMPIAMTLDEGKNAYMQPLNAIKRILVGRDMDTGALSRVLVGDTPSLPFLRLITIRLESVLDPDPAQQLNKIAHLLDYVRNSGANAVLLNPFSGEGIDPLSAYWQTQQLDRINLMSYLSWQLYRKAGAQIYLTIPDVTGHHASDLENHWLPIYAELARRVRVQGVYFEAPQRGSSDVSNAYSKQILHHIQMWNQSIKVIRETSWNALNTSQPTCASQGGDWCSLVLDESNFSKDSVLKSFEHSLSQLKKFPTDQNDQTLLMVSHAQNQTLLIETFRKIRSAGFRSYGYVIDDALSDFPNVESIAPVFSKNAFPYQ